MLVQIKDANQKKSGGTSDLPGPARLDWRTQRRYQTNPLQFYLDLQKTYGDVARYYLYGFLPSVLVSHPEQIKDVHMQRDELARNPRYPRQGMETTMIQRVVGTGLLTTEGEGWLFRRRIFQPAFHEKSIKAYLPIFFANANRLCQSWLEAAQQGEAIDLEQSLMEATLRNVIQALLGQEMLEQMRPMNQGIHGVNDYFSHLMHTILPLPPGVPTRAYRHFKASRIMFNTALQTIIDKAWELHSRGQKLGPVLTPLLSYEMSDKDRRDEIRTMIMAGYETTAALLTWCLYLLAEPPDGADGSYQRSHEDARDVRAQLEREVDGTFGQETPTWETLSKLVYLRQTLQETLRLFPASWAATRKVMETTEIGGFVVPQGTTLVLSPYVTHRHPAFWVEPTKFDPDRFASKQAARRPPFAYFPFGGGPHRCIGEHFALTEAMVLLARLLQQVRWSLVPGQQPVSPAIRGALRPSASIFLQIACR